MFKKHLIYKRDKWNMMTVEVQGKQLVLREISDQWGEECHTFLARPEMMHWVEKRFKADTFDGTEEERQQIYEAFKEV
jgi:hypothetical protein